jgi:isovaleryl-CoA dehydrogenase
MAMSLIPRIAFGAARRCCRPSHSYATKTIIRAASTKHPKGFEPPTQEDLVELRERVQEFTRKLNP